jgi:hypothetical protein
MDRQPVATVKGSNPGRLLIYQIKPLDPCSSFLSMEPLLVKSGAMMGEDVWCYGRSPFTREGRSILRDALAVG